MLPCKLSRNQMIRPLRSRKRKASTATFLICRRVSCRTPLRATQRCRSRVAWKKFPKRVGSLANDLSVAAVYQDECACTKSDLSRAVGIRKESQLRGDCVLEVRGILEDCRRGNAGLARGHNNPGTSLSPEDDLCLECHDGAGNRKKGDHQANGQPGYQMQPERSLRKVIRLCSRTPASEAQ